VGADWRVCGFYGAGNMGVVKFVEILGFLVKDRSKVFKRYLPQVVSLCVERIYPIVAQLPTVTIRLGVRRCCSRVCGQRMLLAHIRHS
jgi:hypothetical protein